MIDPITSTEVLHFNAQCIPPRATAQQKGAFVCNGKVRFFTKAKVKQAEQTWWHILEPAKAQLSQPLEGPLALNITLTYPHTKSTPKRLREEELPMSVKPDLDNVVKALLDTMTHMAFWNDDSQVFALQLLKQRGPEPGIELQLYEVKHG